MYTRVGGMIGHPGMAMASRGQGMYVMDVNATAAPHSETVNRATLLHCISRRREIRIELTKKQTHEEEQHFAVRSDLYGDTNQLGNVLRLLQRYNAHILTTIRVSAKTSTIHKLKLRRESSALKFSPLISIFLTLLVSSTKPRMPCSHI